VYSGCKQSLKLGKNIVDMLTLTEVTRNGNTKICDCASNGQVFITKFVQHSQSFRCTRNARDVTFCEML